DCPTPSGSAGRASAPLAHAVAYASPATSANLDAVTSLAPKDMALGQIVPFELVVDVSTTPSGPLTVEPYWLTKTTSGGDFGFDPAYGVACAFVDTADAGTTDPGADARVSGYSSSTGDVGTSNEEIRGAISVSGLQAGDRVVVELWVVLKSTIASGVTGNVQSGLTRAYEGPLANVVNTGNQTIPLLRPQEFSSASADVSVTKTDGPDPVQQGGALAYILQVKNTSADTIASGVVVTDTLAPGTTFVSATGAICSASAGTVTCAVGFVEPGATKTITLATTVAPTATTTSDPSTNPESGFAGTTCPTTGVDLCNRVSVAATTSDPVSANNAYVQPTNVIATVAPVPAINNRADLHLEKTASPARVQAGGTLTYALSVRNDGPDTADHVTIVDPLPHAVTFVSADPGCSFAAGAVTCDVGSLAPHVTVTRRLVVTVDAAYDPATPSSAHDLLIAKVEAGHSVPAGQTADLSLSCPGGAAMVDAMPTVDSVDQESGGIDLVRILESRSDPADRGRFVFRVLNGTTGQAQLHLFGVCVTTTTTTADGHAHTLSISDVESQSALEGAGRHDRTLTCPAGTSAVAPGYRSTPGAADLVRSEPSPDGRRWSFGYSLDAPATVQLSVRCLATRTASEAGHFEVLQLTHVNRTVTVAPSDLASSQPYARERVSCPDGTKGIVGSFDLPGGVRQIGSSPQPINRDFVLLNTTGAPVEVRLHLLCLGTRIGQFGHGGEIINRAWVYSDQSDPDDGDDIAEAKVSVDPAAPAPDPEEDAPAASRLATTTPAPAAAPGTPSGMATIATSTASVSATTAAIRIRCARGGPSCIGTLTVRSTAGRTLATVRYTVKAGTTATVRLKAKALKGAKRAVVTVVGRDGRKASRTLTLRRG
ncbi:MAG: hypothetical protein JWM93_2495, partial [Frankiales bacterium]|nr:hypothetical protein [Frankiales bacterium]